MHSIWSIKDFQTVYNGPFLSHGKEGDSRETEMWGGVRTATWRHVCTKGQIKTRYYSNLSSALCFRITIRKNIRCFIGTRKKTTELRVRHHLGANFVYTAFKSTQHTSISVILIFSIFILQRQLPLRTPCSFSLTTLLKKPNQTKTHLF